MHPALHLLAPMVLVFPALAAVELPTGQAQVPSAAAPPPAEQVNIEQRVTIRINPRPAPMPNVSNFIAEGADAGAEPRLALAFPSGLAATDSHLYVADTAHHRILDPV